MPKKKGKISFVTLGCPKNVVDSEVLLKQLYSNNWELASETEHGDVAVINTCGFIEDAKRESIDTILEAVQLKKQGKLRKVIVMGCLSQRYEAQLRSEIPEVDAFIGANQLEEVLLSVGGSLKKELLGERILLTPAHTAYLKISEGCDRPCSFCAIPLIRGPHISRPLEEIVAEARALAAAGARELVIIAQDSTYYGMEIYGKRRLAELLRHLSEIRGLEWLRVMYAFPSGFPEDLIEEFKVNPKICRYLDLPVQHVSDSILSSMRRGVDSRTLKKLIAQIRSRVPGIALRTTIIVGYPGEGEREFQELLSFVKETRFERLGVFTYSREEDTGAYALGDPVPEEVKDERRNLIMEAQQQISLEMNRDLLGQTIRVLVDRKEGDAAIGRTEHDAPEIDNEVTINDAADLAAGQFYDAVVVDSGEYDLFAVPLKKKAQDP